MILTLPVKLFIEDHIKLLEEKEYALFFYLALFNLPATYGKELVQICKELLNIDTDAAIKDALVDWCKDNIALQHRKKLSVSNLLKLVPNFGYDSWTFRQMFIEAVKIAYPNKTVSPDSYGIEYIVEKQ